jgi:hypothetical protein
MNSESGLAADLHTDVTHRLHKPALSRYQAPARRRGREAEGTRLLNERAPKGHRGFESLRLRQFCYFCLFFGNPRQHDFCTHAALMTFSARAL